MIFIQGNTPSSKNSKQFVTLKSGKTMLLNSKTVQKYIKESKVDWIKNKTEFLKMIKDKEKPYKIELYFIRDSKRRFDYINAAQIIFDLMQEYDYIEDDDSTNVIPIFKGFEVDKAKAGVEIRVLKED
nr:MAG TPA: crossover junction endodeoxyribonuclease [Caudoviricetes sp.]